MKRLVALVILTKNSTSHTSPVMLITRKLTKDKRPISDLRLLNTRIKRRNTTTPLLRDIFSILGNSRCQTLSCLDLKDAFHSIRLNSKSKEYCGILPYYGSDHYRYEVLPMGLSISPCRWMQYINSLLDTIPNRSNYLAIMDDLLIHSKKKKHYTLIEDLLKSLISHGIKLSPKKCQLFRKEIVYMGTIFTIKGNRIQIQPLKTRIDGILNTPKPKTPKDCKSFCGAVNYLKMFCPELQKLLEPIYELTKKNMPFHWHKVQDDAFLEIKERLKHFPILTLPIVGGRYILYSDTSRKHSGSTLWQIQEGKPRLIGYASKTLPKACSNYSVTELEIYGLWRNLELWQFWLGSNEFDAVVDHNAIVQILKCETFFAHFFFRQ